jgi:uncharacterized protein YqgC (DUF456 family)
VDWVGYLVASLFALVSLACLALVLAGLPGNWLAIGLAIGLQLLGTVPFTHSPTPHFGVPILAACLALAALAEVGEAAAGAAGTKLGGGSRRGMVGAFVGGLAGAIVATPLVPVPVLGTLAGGLVGSFAGAWIGETTAELRRNPHEKLRAALGAAAGRLAGTVGKLAAGVVIWLLLVYGAFT